MAASVIGLILILGIIGIVAGTGSKNKTPTAVPAANGPDTPKGYKNFSDAAGRFTISVPSAWVSVDPSSGGATATFESVLQANPKLKSVLGDDPSALAAKGMAFLGVNPVSDSGGSDNVNVVVTSAPGFDPSQLDQAKSVVQSELTQIGATSEGITDVTFAGQPALRSADKLPVKSPDGSSSTISQVQYYVGFNHTVYVITLSGSGSELQTIASTFKITGS